MRKKIAAASVLLLLPAFCFAGMAAYVNGGVSNLNPTIGLNAEFQYGHFAAALGAGIMAHNDFGFGLGARGYLDGLDGGPYFELIYGTTAEKVESHKDSEGIEIVDSVEVLFGPSALVGWRVFFGEGWNMTAGAGAALAGDKALFVFNISAGIMAWGDDEAVKNAEKFRKSYVPEEPELPEARGDMPAVDEKEIEAVEAVLEADAFEAEDTAPAGTTDTAK